MSRLSQASISHPALYGECTPEGHWGSCRIQKVTWAQGEGGWEGSYDPGISLDFEYVSP